MEPWEWAVSTKDKVQQSPTKITPSTLEITEGPKVSLPWMDNQKCMPPQKRYGKRLYSYTIDSSTSYSDEVTEVEEEEGGGSFNNYSLYMTNNGWVDDVNKESNDSFPPSKYDMTNFLNGHGNSSKKHCDKHTIPTKGTNSHHNNSTLFHTYSRYTRKLSSKKKRNKLIYKPLKNRGKIKGTDLNYWAYRYWSPFVIIGLFVGLVACLVIAEVLIIHFAHKYIPAKSYQSNYYGESRQYPTLMLWGEGVDGLTRIKGYTAPEEGSKADQYLYNYLNYEDEVRNEGFQDFGKKILNKPSQKFPVFVSLGRVPIVSPSIVMKLKHPKVRNGEEILDSQPSVEQLSAVNDHIDGAVPGQDTTFQRAKTFLLKSNHIPKFLSISPPGYDDVYDFAMSHESENLVDESRSLSQRVKFISKDNEVKTSNRFHRVYLQGSGIKTPAEQENLMVKFVPRQPFDIFALLPKGLRPSVYYNALLMRQTVNEARFRFLILNQSRLLIRAIKRQIEYSDKFTKSMRSFRKGNETNSRFAVKKKFKMSINTLNSYNDDYQFDPYFSSSYRDNPKRNFKQFCPQIPPHIAGPLTISQLSNIPSPSKNKPESCGIIINCSLTKVNDPSSINASGNLLSHHLHKNITMQIKHVKSLAWDFVIKPIPILPDTFPFSGTQSWRVLEGRLRDVRDGGAWSPQGCISRHRLAIIIPFRDREEHLFRLLSTLHPVLQRQGVSYKIYVAEQHGPESFNKAMLMNAAFKEAFLEEKFSCYAFHDVDLIPEDDRNFYSCPKQPRHMSVAIDEMGYKLKYQMLVGGVLIFRPEHFLKVNGYSNLYWGWGAEDDDMANRIQHTNLFITRPPEQIGRYRMIKHVKRTPMSLINRYSLLSFGVQRIQIDGLNSNSYKIVNKIRHPLYTYILMDIGKAPKGF